MQRKMITIWLAVLAVLALVAASCGGGDSDDADTATAASAVDSAAVEQAENDAAAARAAAEEAQAALDAALEAGSEGGVDPQELEDLQAELAAALAAADAATDAAAAAADAVAAAQQAAAEQARMTPGEDVSVTLGRANWSTGYFQAEIYRLMMEELGYDVSDPSELELGPNNAYIAMAQGQMDFWVNSWYPGHLAWLAGELPDGTLVGDHLTIIGEEMIAGGLQGYLVTKSFADEYGVYTMDELNRNAEALAAFDATDPDPGNGKADIFGCPEAWTCDNIITNQILFSGWDNIVQTIAGYDPMFTQAVASANDGVPMVAYTWTPSAYITQLRPGDNVYWMGVDEILDDSNPSGTEGGEEHDQRGEDGNGGYATIGPDQCPSAADNPDGLCPIGWVAADILVTANNDFLADNPAAEALLDAVKLSVIDVSLANVEQGEGADPADLAAAWIADNRETVDGWLEAARDAA